MPSRSSDIQLYGNNKHSKPFGHPNKFSTLKPLGEYKAGSMQAPKGSSDCSADSCPTIELLYQEIAKMVEEPRKTIRRRTLDAIVHVADAWQGLLRAEERDMADAVDSLAQELFLRLWNSIAAEVFMGQRPERKPPQDGTDEGSKAKEAACSTGDGDEAAKAGPKTAVGGERSAAVESAQVRIAQAWDLLDSLPGEAQSYAAALRKLGCAQLGESRFRVTMMEARAYRLEEAKEEGSS